MVKECVLILLLIVVTVFGGTVTIERKYGTLNPYFNQTSWGYMRRVKGSTEQFRLPSIWMQDDVNKRARVDLGKRGTPGFVAEFYFFEEFLIEVRPLKGGKLECKKIPDFNYTMEMSTYGEPNFGLLGRHIMQEFEGVSADVYMGRAIDGNGPLNCLFYCDSETCTKFLGFTIVGVSNQFSYLEYWFGSNLTTTIPSAEWFDLPSECDNPEIELYFDKYNFDGSVKHHSNPHTATASLTTLSNEL